MNIFNNDLFLKNTEESNDESLRLLTDFYSNEMVSILKILLEMKPLGNADGKLTYLQKWPVLVHLDNESGKTIVDTIY